MSSPSQQQPSAAAPQNSTGLSDKIVFYCKDCHDIRPVKRAGRRYVYTCSACGTKNVAFGTPRSIERYFRVTERKEKAAAKAKAQAEGGGKPDDRKGRDKRSSGKRGR
jgi:uncharacterized Zn finger protein